MKRKKRYIPYWMRNRVACPNCGLEIVEEDYKRARLIKVRTPNTLAIHDTVVVRSACPRCGYVEVPEDQLTAPYRKDADLSQEGEP